MKQPASEHAWLGIDVGGANLKLAHTSGCAWNIPFEVWKYPDQLATAIATALRDIPAFDALAVTMTAELCDCYSTKSQGVRAILNAIESVAQGRSIAVWGVDRRFHSLVDARARPHLIAAANWLALAVAAGRLAPPGPALLIDIGSTTTDLIPLSHGNPVPRGSSDLERLQDGELVYAGVRRTPVCALAGDLPYRGRDAGTAAELFATTLDVFLTLGDLAEDTRDRGTADGRPATRAAARDRLARMICADRDTFTEDDAQVLAQSCEHLLLDRLIRAAKRACAETVGRPQAAIVAGSGEFLAQRVARRLLPDGGRIVSLREAWGAEATVAACAWALVELARGWQP